MAEKKKKEILENTVTTVPQDIRTVISRLKNRAPSPAAKKGTSQRSTVHPFPVTEKTRHDENKQPFSIGARVEGEGVYAGTWQPQDDKGYNLGKTFNVFAAPENLNDRSCDRFNYDEAATCIARLEKWHGFNGTGYATEKELYQALKEGLYDGGWFIPPLTLLEDLYAHSNTGTLKNTFNDTILDYYWSSTESGNNPAHMWSVSFLDKLKGEFPKDIAAPFPKQFCRPVRIVQNNAL